MTTMRRILEKKGFTFWFVSPFDPIKVALQRLADHQAGALLVMDGERLLGIFSERDFVRRVAQVGALDLETPVREVMTPRVLGVSLDTSVETCQALMTTKRFRHVPVMKDGMVVGVVSLGDVVKAQLEDREATLKAYEGVEANPA